METSLSWNTSAVHFAIFLSFFFFFKAAGAFLSMCINLSQLTLAFILKNKHTNKEKMYKWSQLFSFNLLTYY